MLLLAVGVEKVSLFVQSLWYNYALAGHCLARAASSCIGNTTPVPLRLHLWDQMNVEAGNMLSRFFGSSNSAIASYKILFCSAFKTCQN